MLEKALDNARSGRDSALADLIEELRIPSISTLRDYRGECRRNAEWLAERLTGLGFETKIVDVVDDGNPVIHSEWMGRPGAPLLTIYGHYDVQPDDPLDEWNSKPFEPVVKDGYVIARGCADNKGNHMAALKAAEAWMGAGGPPINLRFLIEGEEEIGGDALPNYLYESSDALQSDYVLLWDGGFTTDDRPSLVVGMRGSVHIEIEVSGPSRDIHSGSFGGVAPNPCNELARIIHLLKDDDGRITVPGYYDDIADPNPDEKSKWHRPEEPILIKATGVKRLTGESSFEPAERLWARPTLDVTGIIGGFTGEGQKIIIPATCRAKISARLVPNQDPDKVLDSLEAHIHDLASDAVTVKVSRMSKCSPVVLGYDHKGVEAASQAFEESFGEPPVFVRTGGSIPVATAFNEALNALIVTSGISQADSRAHSPNENLRIDNFHKGTEMLIRFMDNLVR
jgi:acetylornithine deacetylase/succinyl-diaminopimelate desuccinylase-like protein